MTMEIGRIITNMIKTIILSWVAATTVSSSAVIADGSGFFPVMVQVVEADSRNPVKGAVVRLEGAGTYKELELDPKRQIKVLPESLGKPVTTDAQGVAVVFYYGRFSTTTIDGKTTYSRSLEGTVVVELDGKEIYRSSLKAWEAKNEFKRDGSSVPWIIVSPPSPKSRD